MGRTVRLGAAARVLMVYVFLHVLGGCTNSEPRLQILYDYGQGAGLPPRPPAPAPPVTRRFVDEYPRGWVPPAGVPERRWAWIVVHHSATDRGDAAAFDREHKERGWEGVGYDFVIGNGTGSGDGEVEVTYRWHQQKTGAHCKTPNNWANEEAVGICLVGDFTRRAPTARQMRSLEELVEFLQKRYRIPKSRIYGHRNTPGAHETECPGRYFPMARLKSALAF
ncbi:MAG TPA: peptidoglycan recognition family protein [Sedimentisphaerales bacterium]|nr:peptidoglycan recognition family protein [Sedimentisphaerales bacterium]